MSTSASRQSSVSSRRPVIEVDIENQKVGCFTISNTVGPLAFLSMCAGGAIVSFGVLDIWAASLGQLQMQLRIDPVLLMEANPNFDGGMTNALPIWYAASGIGSVTGFLQVCTSLAFLVNVCRRRQDLDYPAKMWIVTQLILSLVLLIIIGAVFIAGFSPDWMIFSFGADFILINLLMLLTMPIIRTKEKESTPDENFRLHGIGSGASVFGAFLLFSVGTSPLLKNPIKLIQVCVKCGCFRTKYSKASSSRV